MADKKYYWLKLQDGFFDSKRIKKLRKLAGGDTYTIIYLKMQLVAMKKGGVLEYTGLEKTFAEELALELDEEPENVSVTVHYLLSCGLLEESSESEYFVPYAVMNTGSESTSTRRVREHRERKALHCNADVTPMKQLCNTEIEKEKELEEDEKISLPIAGTSPSQNQQEPDPPKEPETPKAEKKPDIFPFAEFWSVYPKKKAKQDAIKAWDKIKPDEALGKTIIKAVQAQKLTQDWIKNGGAFIPYPATYLNGRRWEDEEDNNGADKNDLAPNQWVGTFL